MLACVVQLHEPAAGKHQRAQVADNLPRRQVELLQGMQDVREIKVHGEGRWAKGEQGILAALRSQDRPVNAKAPAEVDPYTRNPYSPRSRRAVSSAVEHCLHTAGVTSSILVPPTNEFKHLGHPNGWPKSLYGSRYGYTFSGHLSDNRTPNRAVGELLSHTRRHTRDHGGDAI